MPNSEKRPISAEDLYALQLISEPQISPDGRHVVYTQQRVDQKTEKKYTNLWVVSVEGGQPQQFTYGDQTDRAPQWSPDGSAIAFISNRRDEKQAQLYVIPFNGGEARPLTELKGQIGPFRWSPDGTRLVFNHRKKDAEAIAREEDEQKKELGVVARHFTRLTYKADGGGFLPQERWHLWLVSVADGETTQLTDSPLYDELEPSWSPDGSQILFRSNRAEDLDLEWDADDLFLIPATGGEPQKLASPHGFKSHPTFSPDGQWVVYYLHGDRHNSWFQTNLYLTPVDGSTPPRNLTEAYDLEVSHSTINDSAGTPGSPPAWTPDSERVYFQVSRHGSTLLKSVGVDGGDLQEVIGPGGAVGAFNFDAAGERLAYFWATIDDPGQVRLHDLTSDATRQLTEVNQELFAEFDLGETEEVWFKGPDGNDLQGWILKPPGFDPAKTYPAILEIHGGPMAQYGHAFMHEFSFLAGQGYVVFYTNPRGGYGYGIEHCRAIHNNWGSVDYADVMAWTDLVLQKPYIDSERVGVTGGSYGGFMTNWIISHTDRFKAAVSQRSVSNFISMLGSSDLNTRWLSLFGADSLPWENYENYWRQSPLKYFGNVKTPTLVIHSEQDLRCDIEQGEQVFVALKILGVETELVRFPEEPHGLSRGGRTDRRIVRLNHIVRWFDRFLK